MEAYAGICVCMSFHRNASFTCEKLSVSRKKSTFVRLQRSTFLMGLTKPCVSFVDTKRRFPSMRCVSSSRGLPFGVIAKQEKAQMSTEPTLKEKTAKGLFWGGISNAVQQVLVFLFGIFLSRILNAEDYGMVGLLAIFTGVANVLQESGFTAALINRKEFKHEDFNAVFWFNVLVGVGLYVILFFCAPLIADYFEQPDLIWVSRIVFLSFLFGSFGTAQAAFLMKNLMVKERAKIDVFSLLLSNTAALLMALNGMAYWGIAIQVSLYIALGTFFRWYFSPWRPSFQWNMRPLKEMFPFGAKLLITGLFSQLSANIFSVLLGKFYSVQQLGYYTQGSKWTNMGGGLISGMITGVAHPIFAQVAADPLRQVRVLRKMTRLSAFVAFPLMFGLAFVGEEFVLITVSEKWIASVPLL